MITADRLGELVSSIPLRDGERAFVVSEDTCHGDLVEMLGEGAIVVCSRSCVVCKERDATFDRLCDECQEDCDDAA